MLKSCVNYTQKKKFVPDALYGRLGEFVRIYGTVNACLQGYRAKRLYLPFPQYDAQRLAYCPAIHRDISHHFKKRITTLPKVGKKNQHNSSLKCMGAYYRGKTNHTSICTQCNIDLIVSIIY